MTQMSQAMLQGPWISMTGVRKWVTWESRNQTKTIWLL